MGSSVFSSLRRVGAVAVLTVGVTAFGATAAQAHVHVHPDSTASGSYSALTFRVPNESPTAGTVKVAVQLPQDRPFLSVSTKPLPGWTVTTTEAKLPKPAVSEGTTITKAVRTVTWTAQKGNQIAPGEYQEFSISVGPLPAPGTVLLPVVQSYSDGKVVKWDEPTPASGDEPENPAPVLQVTAAVPGDGDAAPPTATATPAATPSATPGGAPSGSAETTMASTGSRSDSAARALGGAALVVALAALAVAVLGRRGGRGSSS